MVLGLGSKKGATVRVEFEIEVQEIRPWKAGTNSRAKVPLVLQWQRGDNRSGKTKSVVPKPDDGDKLVFNESFRLPAKLVREKESKGRNAAPSKFVKKTIVFILQEATTGEKLARCVMDLAEYGDLQSSVPASIPIALGRKNKSGGPTPALFLTIGPVGGKEVRSFASRVSLSSSSPRPSISERPENSVAVTGKSRLEPDLDEDTRASLVAALMSDDDEDKISIESFTDDESTPEESTPKESTPRLGKVSKSPTPELDVGKKSPPTSFTKPEFESVKQSPSSSTTPPKSEAPKPSVSTSETISTSVEKSSSSSSFSPAQAAVRARTESPTSNPTHDRPTPTKHGPGEAAQSPASVAPDEVEKSRNTLLKRSASAEEIPSSASVAPASAAAAASITQLFSSQPVYKISKDAEDAAFESAIRLVKSPQRYAGSPPASGSDGQSSKVITRPLVPEPDEAVTSNGESSPNQAKKIPVSSSELPPIGAHKLADTTGKSSFGESKKAAELVGSRRLHSPLAVDTSAKKEVTDESATPVQRVTPASATSGYKANRRFKSFEDSSFDYKSDTSEDALSESPHFGRSPARSPLRDQQPQGHGPSVLSPQSSLNRKGGENKEVDNDKGIVVSDGRGQTMDESKTSASKDLDITKGIVKDPKPTSPDVKKVLDGEPETNREEPVGEGASVLLTARANLAKMEKRALEELRTKIANAEAKLLAESQVVEKLQGELCDIGAMEVSLYCVVAEHGNSSHKLHTPARRLARLYMHASKHWSPERRIATVKNCVLGLVTVAKSCGSDVSRLTFWWSNVVTLRTVVTQAMSKPAQGDKAQGSPRGSLNGNGSLGWARARRSVAGSAAASFNRRASAQTPPTTPRRRSVEWQEASSYVAALEKIEEWIYSKIVESLWWQAMIPRMQKGVDASTPTSPKGMALLSPSALFGSTNEDLSKVAGDVTGIFAKRQGRRSVNLQELGDGRQGNASVEVWKKAILETLRRLCPVRGAGHECGCLPMLIKMAMEGCVARLDVALFNAILREPDDDVPTDPFSDPVSDCSVLPVTPGGLTFGGGSQLKNVVVTWSTFISGLVSFKEATFVPDAKNGDNTDTPEEPEKTPRFFNLLKATGDLLMLPKEILMDKGIRKEICPMLSVQLIRRVLLNFVPDEFAPDPISPSLLAALNAEASIEKQRQGEADSFSSSTVMAAAPPMVYVAPAAEYVWSWIGEASVDPNGWGKSTGSLLRKGYTSDEDLTVMEQLQRSSTSNQLEYLLGSALQETANGKHLDDSPKQRNKAAAEVNGGGRFELLKKVWGTP